MKIDNKIERPFGGPMIFLGLTFFTVGFIFALVESWILASFSFIIAMFFTFTFSGVEIDTKSRRIKPYNKIFGLLKIGKWETLEIYVGLTLVPMKKVYRTYSRSNRRNISVEKEFRIYLVNKAKKPALALKKCNNFEQAQNSMDELAIWLKLPVYSVKK